MKKKYLEKKFVISRDFKNCVYSYSDPETVSSFLRLCSSRRREKTKFERSGYKLILLQDFPLYNTYLVFKKENTCYKLLTFNIEHFSKNNPLNNPSSKHFPFLCNLVYFL